MAADNNQLPFHLRTPAAATHFQLGHSTEKPKPLCNNVTKKFPFRNCLLCHFPMILLFSLVPLVLLTILALMLLSLSLPAGNWLKPHAEAPEVLELVHCTPPLPDTVMMSYMEPKMRPPCSDDLLAQACSLTQSVTNGPVALAHAKHLLLWLLCMPKHNFCHHFSSSNKQTQLVLMTSN